MRKTILLLISIIAIGAFTTSCTDSKEQERVALEAKIKAEEKAQARAKKAAEELEKLRKADEAQAKAEEEKLERGPIQDKHFLSINMPTGTVKRGDLIEAYVDIAVPFDDAFDAKDIYVDAYISGERNGLSLDKRLFFIGGNSEKSTWKLSYLARKSGECKFVFNIHAKNKLYNSLEYVQNVAKSKNSPIYKFSKKNQWYFRNGTGEFKRAVTANFPLNLDDEKTEKLLQAAKNFGVNTILLRLEAPLWLTVASDNGSQKAGQPNLAAFEKVESIMNSAKKHGISTILNFSSDKSFGNDYANTYYAKSGIAPTVKDFFENAEARKDYIKILQYAVARFGARPDLLGWFVFDGIDGIDVENLDSRSAWLTEITMSIKDLDTDIGRPFILSAKTSSELEFLWGGDLCEVLGFALSDKKDFANAVDSHSEFFVKQYRRPISFTSVELNGLPYSYEEKSGIYMRNALWASLFTRTPLLAVLDLTEQTKQNAALEAFKEVSAFQQQFISKIPSPVVLQLPDKVVQKAAKYTEDSTSIYPAFSQTYLSRENSNDYARLEIDGNGTVVKNSMPDVIQKGAIAYIEVKDVPHKKCSLNIEIPFISKDGVLDLEFITEEKSPKKFKISASEAKKSMAFGDVEMFYVNKTIKIPLEQGDNKFTVQIEGSDNVKARLGIITLNGMGSFKGFAAVSARAVASEDNSKMAIWFKRSGMDAYNFGKYNLAGKNIGELKPFEYLLKVGAANAKYKVVWWSTRAGAILASGEIKSSADSILKLKVPTIKTDIACFIEKID